MVQVPPVSNVTVAPLTVHTLGVCELKLIGKLDVALALNPNGLSVRLRSGSVPNVMVWLSWPNAV